MAKKSKKCPRCDGKGGCPKCGAEGWTGLILKSKCKLCDGSGKCPRCQGACVIPCE